MHNKKNQDKLELIIVNGSEEDSKQVKQMKGYASKLWRFSVDNKILPRFISVLTDHDRIVITVSNAEKNPLTEAFRKANYTLKPYNIDPRETQIFSKDKLYSMYEVKVAVEGKAYCA